MITNGLSGSTAAGACAAGGRQCRALLLAQRLSCCLWCAWLAAVPCGLPCQGLRPPECEALAAVPSGLPCQGLRSPECRLLACQPLRWQQPACRPMLEARLQFMAAVLSSMGALRLMVADAGHSAHVQPLAGPHRQQLDLDSRSTAHKQPVLRMLPALALRKLD